MSSKILTVILALFCLESTKSAVPSLTLLAEVENERGVSFRYDPNRDQYMLADTFARSIKLFDTQLKVVDNAFIQLDATAPEVPLSTAVTGDTFYLSQTGAVRGIGKYSLADGSQLAFFSVPDIVDDFGVCYDKTRNLVFLTWAAIDPDDLVDSQNQRIWILDGNLNLLREITTQELGNINPTRCIVQDDQVIFGQKTPVVDPTSNLFDTSLVIYDIEDGEFEMTNLDPKCNMWGIFFDTCGNLWQSCSVYESVGTFPAQFDSFSIKFLEKEDFEDRNNNWQTILQTEGNSFPILDMGYDSQRNRLLRPAFFGDSDLISVFTIADNLDCDDEDESEEEQTEADD